MSHLTCKCLCAEPKLTVRRGSDSALYRAVSDTSSECSTDATVVSALQKYQLTSGGNNIQSAALPSHHSVKHPVRLCFSLHFNCVHFETQEVAHSCLVS